MLSCHGTVMYYYLSACFTYFFLIGKCVSTSVIKLHCFFKLLYVNVAYLCRCLYSPDGPFKLEHEVLEKSLNLIVRSRVASLRHVFTFLLNEKSTVKWKTTFSQYALRHLNGNVYQQT